MLKAAAVVVIALVGYAVCALIVSLMGRFALWVNGERKPPE